MAIKSVGTPVASDGYRGLPAPERMAFIRSQILGGNIDFSSYQGAWEKANNWTGKEVEVPDVPKAVPIEEPTTPASVNEYSWQSGRGFMWNGQDVPQSVPTSSPKPQIENSRAPLPKQFATAEQQLDTGNSRREQAVADWYSAFTRGEIASMPTNWNQQGNSVEVYPDYVSGRDEQRAKAAGVPVIRDVDGYTVYVPENTDYRSAYIRQQQTNVADSFDREYRALRNNPQNRAMSDAVLRRRAMANIGTSFVDRPREVDLMGLAAPVARELTKVDVPEEYQDTVRRIAAHIFQNENQNAVGYNKDLDVWFPHDSFEGGNQTIGYGLKLGAMRSKNRPFIANPDTTALYMQQGYLTGEQMNTLSYNAVASRFMEALKQHPEYIVGRPYEYIEDYIDDLYNSGNVANVRQAALSSVVKQLSKATSEKEINDIINTHNGLNISERKANGKTIVGRTNERRRVERGILDAAVALNMGRIKKRKK